MPSAQQQAAPAAEAQQTAAPPQKGEEPEMHTASPQHAGKVESSSSSSFLTPHIRENPHRGEMKPTDHRAEHSNIQVRCPQPCCSSEDYFSPGRTPFPTCLTAGSVLSCYSRETSFHFSATAFCRASSFVLHLSSTALTKFHLKMFSSAFTILFSSPHLSFSVNVHNYAFHYNHLQHVFLLQRTALQGQQIHNSAPFELMP